MYLKVIVFEAGGPAQYWSFASMTRSASARQETN
jgi:hypothetical protein